MSSLEEHKAGQEDDSVNVMLRNSNSNPYSFYSSEDNIEITCNASSQPDVITIGSSDDNHQVSANERSWSTLPSLVVENIYSFLGRPDQSSMSQVCSAWSKDFSSPSVWKTMKFHLLENGCSSEIYPEVKFARKFGIMFCQVEITCTRVRSRHIGVIFKQLCWFLQAMESSSQLTSIKFINMGTYIYLLGDKHRKELLRTIISFFKSQENLKTVTFQGSHFNKDEGLELLKAVLHSDSNVIKDLTLIDFVIEFPSREISEQYTSNLLSVCNKFENVQSLDIDYTQMFEDVIICLYQNLSSGKLQLDKTKPRMTDLNIHCEGRRCSLIRGIQPDTWKYLTNSFPNMKVKIEANIHYHLNSEMQMFLVRGIPLQSLDFCFENLSASTEISISDLFTHLQICKYQDHLEVLKINWIPLIENFALSDINFVQSCKKLQTFHLQCACEPSEIENVLQVLLKNHPAPLKSITIWVNYLRANEEINLRALAEEYYSLFIAEGIECFLVGVECFVE